MIHDRGVPRRGSPAGTHTSDRCGLVELSGRFLHRSAYDAITGVPQERRMLTVQHGATARRSSLANEAVEKLTGATIASLAFLHCQTFQ